MAEAEEYEGRVLAGRYRLTEKVNEGGMGAIWRAEHLVLRAPVAVKLIDRDVLEQPNAVDRFMREARAAASLRSPHVVQILDYGVDVDVPFIVMELLEGETLAQKLRRKTRLSPEETAHLLAHVGRAMARAHEAGIVHRDLKPDNIFIVQNEDEELAKVLDFGVAKVNAADISADGAKTRTGSLLGTPYYMSPEQVQGNKDVDHRSDLWSLGVIAFECMTGERPFASTGLGDLVLQICVRDRPQPSAFARVPALFDAWFYKACEREPSARFQGAREMIDDLRRALGVELKGSSDSQPEFSNRSEPRLNVSSGWGAESDAPTVVAAPHNLSLSGTDRVVSGATFAESARSQILESQVGSSGAPAHRRFTPLAWVGVLTLALGVALGLWVYPRAVAWFGATPAALKVTPVESKNRAARSDSVARKRPRALASSSSRPTEKTSAPTASSPPTAPTAPTTPTAPTAPIPPAKPLEPPAAERPDAGWIKPSWAIPDEPALPAAPAVSQVEPEVPPQAP